MKQQKIMNIDFKKMSVTEKIYSVRTLKFSYYCSFMHNGLRLRHYDHALYKLSLYHLPRLGEYLDTGKYNIYIIATFICVIKFIKSHIIKMTYLQYLLQVMYQNCKVLAMIQIFH